MLVDFDVFGPDHLAEKILDYPKNGRASHDDERRAPPMIVLKLNAAEEINSLDTAENTQILGKKRWTEDAVCRFERDMQGAHRIEYGQIDQLRDVIDHDDRCQKIDRREQERREPFFEPRRGQHQGGDAIVFIAVFCEHFAGENARADQDKSREYTPLDLAENEADIFLRNLVLIIGQGQGAADQGDGDARHDRDIDQKLTAVERKTTAQEERKSLKIEHDFDFFRCLKWANVGVPANIFLLFENLFHPFWLADGGLKQHFEVDAAVLFV